jgi:hypothetical protein
MEPGGADGGNPRAGQHGERDGQHAEAAQEDDLERAHVPLQLAHRDGHRGEGEHRAEHPQGAAHRRTELVHSFCLGAVAILLASATQRG